jgi:hypothetical protein
MAHSLEALLSAPPLSAAMQVALQSGKPAYMLNAHNQYEAAGAPLPEGEVEAMLMQVLPEKAKAQLQTANAVMVQVSLANIGVVEVRVARDATGVRAQITRLSAMGGRRRGPRCPGSEVEEDRH